MQGPRRDIFRIAHAQRGLITRDDLRLLGVSPKQRRTLVAEGTLRPVGRQTFVVGAAPPDLWRAALLASLDEGGPVSHRSGLQLQGVPGIVGPNLPDVLTTRSRRSNDSLVATVHSTTWLPADDVTTVDGIPCTSVARSLFNLAGLVPEVDLEDVRGAVDEAIRLGKASDGWLWWRLEKLRCRGRSGVSNLEGILVRRAAGEVTESWLEREFLRVLADAGVPAPRCQRRVRARGSFLARVDFLYEDLGIVVEVTGAAAHSSRQQRAADATRRNRLGMLGYLVLEFTYEQVVGDPAAVVVEIWNARASRGQLRRGA